MQKAFTLAETLITLGIVGVVAALTISTAITQHQKKVTISKLEKSISILNQAYRLSIAELGESDNAFELGAEAYFNTYWKPYIKSVKICPRNNRGHVACGYKSRMPFMCANKTPSYREFSRAGNDRTAFYTPDGFLYIVFTGLMNAEASAYNGIMVDINGAAAPNRYGRDVFLLQRNKEKGIVEPEGYNKTDSEVDNNCSTRGSGDYCAEKIRRNGWKISADYPW